LYKKDIDNSWLCAPNRLYQALIRGIPVIVGINPPMTHLVNKYNCGIALSSDGSSIEEIKNGIIKIIENQAEFNKNTKHCLDDISWESQMPVFKEIMKI